MKFFNQKNKNTATFAWALLLTLLIHFYGYQLTHPIFGQRPHKTFSRGFEDKTYYPVVSPQTTFHEHLKVVSPTLILTSCIVLLIIIFGIGSSTNFVLLLIFFSSVFILLLTCIFNTQQFFIILLPIFSSYLFISSLLKKINIIDKINLVILALFCQIIFITQSLSIFHSVEGPLFLVLGFTLWLMSLRNYKSIAPIIQEDIHSLQDIKNELIQLMEQNKLVGGFFLAILISILWRMMLIYYYPPNNADAMTYHLSRVAYWMHHRSLDQFYTHNIRQTIFPFNSEILLLWTMISSRMDSLCSFIQFVAYILSGGVIYKCLREYLNIAKLDSLTIVFIWYALPLNVLQSTTPKNDLVLAYLIILSAAYFVLGLNSNKQYLFISGLATGLAIGTKTTVLFYLVPFSVVILTILISRRYLTKNIFFWGLITLGSIILFSSYNYVQNYFQFGNIIGPSYFINHVKMPILPLHLYLSNFMQILYQIVVNQTGLPFYFSILCDHYIDFVSSVGKTVFGFFNIPINVPGTFLRGGFKFDSWLHIFEIREDYAAFGPTGALLVFLPVYILIKTMVNLLFKRNFKNAVFFGPSIFAFIFFIFIILLSCLYRWDPWNIRYLIAIGPIGILLLAIFFKGNYPLIKNFISFINIYCIFLLIPTTFMNQLKPLTPYIKDIGGIKLRQNQFTNNTENQIDTEPHIHGVGWRKLTLNKDRIGLRFLLRPSEENFARSIEKNVPKNSKVGTVLTFWQWNYPMFGEKLRRTIIPVNTENITRESFDYIVVNIGYLNTVPQLKYLIQKYYKKALILKRYGYSEIMQLYIPAGSKLPRN